MSSNKVNEENLRNLSTGSPSSNKEVATKGLVSSASSAGCGLCFGTGMHVVPGKGARRCDCQSEDRVRLALTAARIPRRYEHCSIHNFENPSAEISKYHALGISDKLIREYLHEGSHDGRGLLFVGSVGVGKTHLAVAILRGLIEEYRWVTGLFYQSGALLKEIQDSYSSISQTSELRVLAPVFEADVLVLDELGGSKPTDWVGETMMQIINTRYNDKKLTIFTTNYWDEIQLRSHLDRLNDRLAELRKASHSQQGSREEVLIQNRIKVLLKSESLEDRIGVRLRSRLYEMCQAVTIEGEDYRRRLSNPAR
ncbi:MAG: replication protein DnaC [Blastocatellia bacterium]|jgi:DNA replication protein DnaC|nr:replication protein DnaC [Blastocatellia bacterium]